MWVETLTNSKGTRYKYCERYELQNGDTRKVSITLNSNSTYAHKQASIELQNKIKDVIKERNAVKHKITFHTILVHDIASRFADINTS